MFSARTIDAGEALQLGLIDAVVDDHEALDRHVEGLAATIASGAPLAHRAHKALLQWVEHDTPATAARARAAAQTAWSSADFVEGRRAFLERRPPIFTGR
jgi:enoyl-CoA hydratase